MYVKGICTLHSFFGSWYDCLEIARQKQKQKPKPCICWTGVAAKISQTRFWVSLQRVFSFTLDSFRPNSCRVAGVSFFLLILKSCDLISRPISKNMIPGQLLKFGKAYFSFWNNRSHLRPVLFFRVIGSEIEGSDRFKTLWAARIIFISLWVIYMTVRVFGVGRMWLYVPVIHDRVKGQLSGHCF